MRYSYEVSVVIPTYNAADTLGGQLEALSAQKCDYPWELIIVNNGSTDNSRQVVEKYTKDFPIPVRIIDAYDGQGVGYARNRGAVIAKGKIIAFCDADDRVDKNWIKAIVEGEDLAPITVGARRELRTPFDPEAPFFNEPIAHMSTRGGRTIRGCNFTVSNAAYRSLGGFDESFPPYGCEDIEFALRAHEQGIDVAENPDMIVYFRTSSSTAKFKKVFLSGVAEVYVWVRHPDRHGNVFTISGRLLNLLRFPIDTINRTLRMKKLYLNPTVRDFLQRTAHLITVTRLKIRGIPEAQLLSEKDFVDLS
ncbi:glycosyltransferase family 2 protein [Dermabacteraceae bacterium P7074]